jgi:hypothetical protein
MRLCLTTSVNLNTFFGALLCHAIDENATKFSLHHGFIESPIELPTAMLNVAKLAKAL